MVYRLPSGFCTSSHVVVAVVVVVVVFVVVVVVVVVVVAVVVLVVVLVFVFVIVVVASVYIVEYNVDEIGCIQSNPFFTPDSMKNSSALCSIARLQKVLKLLAFEILSPEFVRAPRFRGK